MTQVLKDYTGRIAAPVLILIIGVGCGAPLEKASQVQSEFTNSTLLSQKVARLCTVLKARSEEPRILPQSIMDSACANPAQSFQVFHPDAKALGFSQIETSVEEDGGRGFMNVEVLAEIALGQTLIRSISQLLKDFAKQTNEPSEDEEFRLKVIEKAKLNKETLKLAGVLELQSPRDVNHLVDIKNRVNLAAEVVEGSSIIATLTSQEDVGFETSIIKNLRITILAVPIDDDVYMAVGGHFRPHRFGADPVLKKQFIESLSESLMQIPRLFHGMMGK